MTSNWPALTLRGERTSCIHFPRHSMALISKPEAATEEKLLSQNPAELQLTLLVDKYSIARFDPASFPLKSLIAILSSAASSPTTSRSFFRSGSTLSNGALVNLSVTPSEVSMVCPTLTIISGNCEHQSSRFAIGEDWNPQAVETGWLALRVDPSPSYSPSPSPSSTPTDLLHPIGETKKIGLPPSIDFSVVGIMARISGLLANEGVSLFAVSTYDTDYVLVKEQKIGVAVRALREDGCQVVLEDPQRVQWRSLLVNAKESPHHEPDSQRKD